MAAKIKHKANNLKQLETNNNIKSQNKKSKCNIHETVRIQGVK